MSALLSTPLSDAFADTLSDAPRPTDWATANRAGLMQAATDDWHGATDAFRAAVTAIELDGQTTASAGQHSPLALVLSNLAQSLYRTGQVEEAIRYQERVVALRIAMTGEGSVAVARSRSDLAAMLGSIGRVEEAAVLARRALMAVESSGAPDMALAAVLANAARIAIVADATKDAEPILRRLHAVEARCGLDSTATDRLLERIGAAPVTPAAGSPLLIDLDEVFPAPTQSAPIAPTVRFPSPTPLAFTHEIEFVEESVDAISDVAVDAVEDTAVEVHTGEVDREGDHEAALEAALARDADADDLAVGEYPHFPTSEQAALACDVRAASTLSPTALAASGAYHLVDASESPVETDALSIAEPAATSTSRLERRVAERRRAERATKRTHRTLLIAGSVVAVATLATLVAIFR